MGQRAPASQARPRDTGNVQPSHLAARTIRQAEHGFSQFDHHPWPVEGGFGAAVKCSFEKNVYPRDTVRVQRTEISLCQNTDGAARGFLSVH